MGTKRKVPERAPLDECLAAVPVGEGRRNAEGAERYVCPECQKVFDNPTGLGAHRRHVHGIESQTPSAIRARQRKLAAPAPDENIDLERIHADCVAVYRAMGGARWLQDLAKDDPSKFLTFWQKVDDMVRKTGTDAGPVTEMSDAELSDLLKSVRQEGETMPDPVAEGMNDY